MLCAVSHFPMRMILISYRSGCQRVARCFPTRPVHILQLLWIQSLLYQEVDGMCSKAFPYEDSTDFIQKRMLCVWLEVFQWDQYRFSSHFNNSYILLSVGENTLFKLLPDYTWYFSAALATLLYVSSSTNGLTASWTITIGLPFIWSSSEASNSVFAWIAKTHFLMDSWRVSPPCTSSTLLNLFWLIKFSTKLNQLSEIAT